MYANVIAIWESITNNLVNEKDWLNNKQKVQFIENLLGEIEKKTWIKIVYEDCPWEETSFMLGAEKSG